MWPSLLKIPAGWVLGGWVFLCPLAFCLSPAFPSGFCPVRCPSRRVKKTMKLQSARSLTRQRMREATTKTSSWLKLPKVESSSVFACAGWWFLRDFCGCSCPGFLPSLRRLLGTPAYFLLLCGSILKFNAFIGLLTFKAKYMEQQFGQSASRANFLIGKNNEINKLCVHIELLIEKWNIGAVIYWHVFKHTWK